MRYANIGSSLRSLNARAGEWLPKRPLWCDWDSLVTFRVRRAPISGTSRGLGKAHTASALNTLFLTNKDRVNLTSKYLPARRAPLSGLNVNPSSPPRTAIMQPRSRGSCPRSSFTLLSCNSTNSQESHRVARNMPPSILFEVPSAKLVTRSDKTSESGLVPTQSDLSCNSCRAKAGHAWFDCTEKKALRPRGAGQTC